MKTIDDVVMDAWDAYMDSEDEEEDAWYCESEEEIFSYADGD